MNNIEICLIAANITLFLGTIIDSLYTSKELGLLRTQVESSQTLKARIEKLELELKVQDRLEKRNIVKIKNKLY